MTRNLAASIAGDQRRDTSRDAVIHAALDRLDGRSIVMVGLMGAGKTTIGRRLAAGLGLTFVDADAEIEQAAGCSVAELFDRYGEQQFRVGERRVIARLLGGRQAVIATGGGAVVDPATRRLIRERAVSVWLRCSLDVLVRRVSARGHRPLLRGKDAKATLDRLLSERQGYYAEADLTVECGDDGAEQTTAIVMTRLASSGDIRRVRVALADHPYDVMIGDGLIGRAGSLLGSVLPHKRCVVVTDDTVATLHLPALMASFAESGIAATAHIVPAGEASKRLATFGHLTEAILAAGVERRTTIVALGGGVVGDLAGFVAATLLRGLPFVQIPTTLLGQVDSSVGGKTGINSASGKNLIGAFHQPIAVLADTSALATLSPRELRAGYAEIVKAGLIGDADLFAWCERHGGDVVGGDRRRQADAIERASAFKAALVVDDEREERSDGGRALLNLGHTFGHALEAEFEFDGRLLHGEAVAIGCHLAFSLSARLGRCASDHARRVTAHLREVGLPTALAALPHRPSAARLLAHMTRDKKVSDGVLTFILAGGIGEAVTDRSVCTDDVRALLIDEGCDA